MRSWRAHIFIEKKSFHANRASLSHWPSPSWFSHSPLLLACSALCHGDSIFQAVSDPGWTKGKTGWKPGGWQETRCFLHLSLSCSRGRLQHSQTDGHSPWSLRVGLCTPQPCSGSICLCLASPGLASSLMSRNCRKPISCIKYPLPKISRVALINPQFLDAEAVSSLLLEVYSCDHPWH